MPECPTCGMPNQDDASMCVVCGKRLKTGMPQAAGGRTCPDCGAGNPEDAVVCSLCGRTFSVDSAAAPTSPADLSAPTPSGPSSRDEISQRLASRQDELARSRRRMGLIAGAVLVVLVLGGITGMIWIARISGAASGGASGLSPAEADRQRRAEVNAIHQQLEDDNQPDVAVRTLEGVPGEWARLSLDFPLFDAYAAAMEKNSQLEAEAMMSHGPNDLGAGEVDRFRLSSRTVRAWALEVVPESIQLKDAFNNGIMGGVSFRPTGGMSRDAWVYCPDGRDGIAVLAVSGSQRVPYGEPTVEGTGRLSRAEVMRLGQLPEQEVRLIEVDWPVYDVALDLSLRLPDKVAGKSYTLRFGPMMVSSAEEHQSSSGGWRSTKASIVGVPIYCASLQVRGDAERGVWLLSSPDLLE